MPTTTLDYITAEDGTSDTIDLSQRLNVLTDAVYINDIDIRWRGNETRRENTVTQRATNVNTNSSTGDRTTETITDTEYYWDYEENTNSDTFTATVEESKIVTRSNVGGTFTSFPSSPGSEYSVSAATLTVNADAEPYAEGSINVNGSTLTTLNATRSGRVYYFERNRFDFNPGDIVSVYIEGPDSTTTETKMSFKRPRETNFGRATAEYPPVPNGYQFDHHEYISGGINSNLYSKVVGLESISNQRATEDGETVSVTLKTVGRDRRSRTTTETITNFENPPAETTFPSVPDGYDFEKHEVRGDINNRYIYNNRVGETVQSNRPQSDGETVTIEAVTYGTQSQTNVSLDQTEYIELTGDVTASLSTRLNDDEQTTKFNVNQHQSGITDTLDVNYNVGSSDFADYQLTIDWEYPYALPQHGSLALKDSGQWYLVANADPNSPALKHNHIRLYDDQTDTWGAIDVAPVDEPRTIESYRFYDHQTDQWFAPRYYDTRQA